MVLQKALLDDIVKEKMFGPVLALTWVIESQKRGLLHAHILVTLAPPFHPDSPAKIDTIVSAELPDETTVRTPPPPHSACA